MGDTESKYQCDLSPSFSPENLPAYFNKLLQKGGILYILTISFLLEWTLMDSPFELSWF